MFAPTLPQREGMLPACWYPPLTPASTGSILEATDCTVPSDSASRAASAIAEKLSAIVEVVIVVDPVPTFVPEPSVLLQPLVDSPELLKCHSRPVSQSHSLPEV